MATDKQQDQNRESAPPIVIYGSGRSGTTWIQDVIAEANGFRTLFEPLHTTAVKGAAPHANRYVRVDVRDDDLTRFMDSVFDGTIRSIWVNYRQRPDFLVPRVSALYRPSQARLLVSRYRALYANYRRYSRYPHGRLVIKFIRANLMIPWLHAHYPAKSLFFVRHPCAVIDSQLRQGGNWDTRALDTFLKDPALNEDLLCRHSAFLNRDLDGLEAHTAIWCIQNVIPLRQTGALGIPTIYYEQLLMDPESEWNRIRDHLDLAVLPNRDRLMRPSQQASKEAGDKVAPEDVVGRWQRRLTASQMQTIQSVLDEFGVTLYNVRSVMPVPEPD